MIIRAEHLCEGLLATLIVIGLALLGTGCAKLTPSPAPTITVQASESPTVVLAATKFPDTATLTVITTFTPVPTPASTADFGPEAAWDAPSEFYSEFDDCWRDTSADPPECLISTMQNWGASPQAVKLAELLDGDGFAESYEECGAVDVAQVFHLPRPYVVYQHVLINGKPRVVYALDDLGEIDIAPDPLYLDLAQKYPDLRIEGTPSTVFEGMEQLPQGGQRFIFSYNLVDGCRVCRTGSRAFVAFDFDHAGQFLGTEFLYLEE